MLAGVEASKNTIKVNIIRGTGFSNSTLKTPQDAAVVIKLRQMRVKTFLSILEESITILMEKYLLSVTARRDGSSVFGTNSKNGVFSQLFHWDITSVKNHFLMVLKRQLTTQN